MKKVIVLDRDGTIVVDRHYLADPRGLEFEAGAELGLRKMAAMGCRLVVITNQSGVARGLLSLERLSEIHARLKEMMAAIGAPLEAIYFCPHGSAEACACRKPELGLLRQAAQELNFDMSQSIVIGDKQSDVAMGRRAGATTILIGGRELPRADAGAYSAADLSQAADLISSLLA